MNFIRKVKENLKDPKKKSLTILGIYLIFFIIVFVLLRTGESANYNYKEEITEEKKFNYEYTYIITDNENIIELNGKYKDNIYTFSYNGMNYVKENDIVYLDNVPTEIDFKIDKYKYDNIELLIENSDSETKYKDSNIIVYSINLIKYFELLNEESNCSEVDCSIINVPIKVEKDKFINSVFIDLSEYYGYKYNVEIQYIIMN